MMDKLIIDFDGYHVQAHYTLSDEKPGYYMVSYNALDVPKPSRDKRAKEGRFNVKIVYVPCVVIDNLRKEQP